METPCVKICTMEEDTGWCAGCWRTLDEIMDWTSLSAGERRRIMASLDARRLRATEPASSTGRASSEGRSP